MLSFKAILKQKIKIVVPIEKIYNKEKKIKREDPKWISIFFILLINYTILF